MSNAAIKHKLVLEVLDVACFQSHKAQIRAGSKPICDMMAIKK
jgi:hypothetical protein